MRNKLLIISILALILNACSKNFLDITPKTFVSSASFFQTESDFTQALNGAYSSLRNLYSDAYVMGEMRSDNTHYYYKYNDRGPQNVGKEDVSGFVDNSINAYSANKYYNCYLGISRVNAILGRITGSAISSTVKDEITGEAKFLRAFFYFELVQYYGDVPLHLTEVTAEGQTALPRTVKADVYKQITTDVNDAITKLPTTQTNKGRVTKGSAKTLLAYVYMTLKQYAQAQVQLTDVTGLGYSLLSDYASVFDTKNKNNKESIFEIQYQQGNQGQQSTWTYQFIPALADTKYITSITGNNQSFGGWNIPTDDLIATYENGDKRKDASIAMGYTDATGTFVTMPFVKKYLHTHSLFNNCDDDWMVYRYSDVLLLLAECLNEQSKATEALPYLNQVRNRAGLGNTTETNQAALRAIIAHERRVELAFENHRWLDLVRTGQAITVMNAFGAAMKLKHPDYLQARTYNVTDNLLIFPIPQNEITLNPALTQNPGY